MRAKRDYAMLAMLVGCGFCRSELVGLEFAEIQMRQGHWAVVDLIGKGGLIRTVPFHNGSKRHSISGSSSQGDGGKDLSGSCQGGKGVGKRHLAECRVVRSQGLQRESGLGAYCAA